MFKVTAPGHMDIGWKVQVKAGETQPVGVNLTPGPVLVFTINEKDNLLNDKLVAEGTIMVEAITESEFSSLGVSAITSSAFPNAETHSFTNGNAEIRVKPGFYKFKIRAPGYQTMGWKVEVDRGLQQPVGVSMTPA